MGLLFDNEQYQEISAQQLRNIMPHLAKYGSAYSNWSMLLLDEVFGTNEVAIVGADAEAFRLEMEKITFLIKLCWVVKKEVYLCCAISLATIPGVCL
ncbi:hypothetical protein [Mucilaginibacter humi]|uniref:hypothetical protein n=1 Tax=Mucilaginibacter humi TaxID=2732510 RepID=UPI00293B8D4A|nr:hypothetical protein [Mucilaginibacter humi]